MNRANTKGREGEIVSSRFVQMLPRIPNEMDRLVLSVREDPLFRFFSIFTTVQNFLRDKCASGLEVEARIVNDILSLSDTANKTDRIARTWTKIRTTRNIVGILLIDLWKNYNKACMR